MAQFISVDKAVLSGKSFTVTTDIVSVGQNTEYPLLLLKNPSTASRILITHFKQGVDSTSVRSIIRIYSNPTITANGTTITPINTYMTDSPPASKMELYKEPTISDNGGILNMDISPSNSPSKGLNRLYWVDPGNSLLVTIDNSVSNANSFADIYWLEGV